MGKGGRKKNDRVAFPESYPFILRYCSFQTFCCGYRLFYACVVVTSLFIATRFALILIYFFVLLYKMKINKTYILMF